MLDRKIDSVILLWLLLNVARSSLWKEDLHAATTVRMNSVFMNNVPYNSSDKILWILKKNEKV